jgi:hypothetical protein
VATTDPAPEWDWYSSRDLFVGHVGHGDGPIEEAVEEWLEEIRERDRKRIPPGFQLPAAAEKPRKRKRK